MKTNSMISNIRSTMLAVASVACIPSIYATPQMDPAGPIESAELIQMELFHDKMMKGAEISIRIDGKIAVLSGTARSIAQAERAAARAYCSPEVVAVADSIRILEHPSGAIAEAAKKSLNGRALLDASEITIKVIGSKIVLNGEIGSLDEAELAREIVSEIDGVTTVENRLVVNFESIRTDKQIAAQLDFDVQDDPLFTGLDLAPEVKNGVVTWSGQVGSKGEFDRLVRISYVTGIIEADASKVRVNSDLAMEAVEDKDYTPAQTVEAYAAAIALIPGISEGDVRAENLDGTMILTGNVASKELAPKLERTARAIPGVLAVSNRLEIGESLKFAENTTGKPTEAMVSSSVAPKLKPSR